MNIETFIENRIVLYYFILFFFVSISILTNLPKETRFYQTKTAKFYLVSLLISVFLIITGYAFEDVVNSNSGEGLLFVFLLIAYAFKESFPIIMSIILVVGMFVKFGNKLNGENSNVKSINANYNYSGYNPPGASNPIQKKVDIKKRNFLMKWFYNDDNTVNETGSLISKLSLVLTVALMIVYIVIPIFAHYDIDLLFSKIALIFIIMTLFEMFQTLEAVKPEPKKAVVKKKAANADDLTNTLKDVLRLSLVEKLNLNEKMIGKKDVILNSPSALLCEVPNANELKEINKKIMNTAFFENKKVLVICLNDKKAKEYHIKLTRFNKEYDGKLVLKHLTENDKLFDSSVEIYVTAIENCFGNIKLLSEIDTIIIEDYDEILLNKLELLRALGSIVKMGNPKMDYIIITYLLQGIEATVKNLLYVKDISCYCTENKQQPSQVKLSVWEKNDNFITEKLFGKPIQNLGSLVPLSLISVKWEPDRIILISKTEPLHFELNELNAMRNLHEKNIDNTELKLLGDKYLISTDEKYFSYAKKNWIIIDDKNNLYEKIYKLSLINGIENRINIVSEQYMLRDYMIENYNSNKSRIKEFLPYVPYEVNSGKVVLYNLLLQLTNFGVKENIIANILNENGIKIKLGKGNNVRHVVDKINYFIKQEFLLDVDIYSYITLVDVKDKYVFDMSKKKFVEEERLYVLDEMALRLFPNEIFGRVTFVKDGFALDIEKEYAYNFYQKYLPGQKHFFDGYVYEIKNVIETENGVNAILEASTNYNNNTYRQDRRVEYINNFLVSECKINKYSNVMIKYQMGKADYKIYTEGYFEFKNGISKMPGEYRYVGLDENNIERTIRVHNKADVAKIDIIIPKAENVDELAQRILNDELGQKLAFLFSEVLVSMLGENSKYIQVKTINRNDDAKIQDENWCMPIIEDGYLAPSIEIYLLEDTQIERGLIDMIYKNLDNIFRIIYEYLDWIFKAEDTLDANIKKDKFLYNVERTDAAMIKYRNIYEMLKEVMLF